MTAALLRSRGGRSAGKSGQGGSGHGGATTRKDAAQGAFDSVWGDDDCSRITAERAPPGDAKTGAYGDLARNLDELVERKHEESGGSASSLTKDPRETNLGSKGDLS